MPSRIKLARAANNKLTEFIDAFIFIVVERMWRLRDIDFRIHKRHGEDRAGVIESVP